MTDRLVLRRLLWAMTALCLIVGLIAIPVVGDDERVAAGDLDAVTDTTGRSDEGVPNDDEADGEGDAGGTVGTEPGPNAADGVVATPAPGSTSDGRSPAPTASPDAATTTLPPQPEGLGAPTDPGPPVPPRPGVYRYRTSGGPDGDGESTTRVEERGRSGGEVRLSVTSAGGRLTTTSEVVWRLDGVRTLRSTITVGDRSGECDWEPDVIDAVFPLEAGATWRSDSSCAVTGLTPAPITLQRTSSAKVLELRRTQVAGQTVDVWAIEHVERLSGGGMSEEVTVVSLFSPKHGIDVDLRGTRSGEEYRRELLSLEPAPA